MSQLYHYLDNQLIILTQYLTENPGLHKSREYHLDRVEGVDFPYALTLDSYELFAIMSSAFSINRRQREKFFEVHPGTKKYLSTLGPNRLQYAMLVFNFLKRMDELVIGLVEQYIAEIDNFHEILEIYHNVTEFRIKCGIFRGSNNKMRTYMVTFDKDPRVRGLKYKVDTDNQE